MNLFIRSALLKDAHSVYIILSEMGYAHLDNISFLKSWEEFKVFSGTGILVAEYDGIVVGVLNYTITPCLSLSGSLMRIELLGILTKVRNQGIGSSLLNEAKKIAAQKGVSQIILSTSKDRESYKRNFYVKQGFVEKNSAWFKCEL